MFEKVNPSHPDKIADRIAGAIVDLAYTKQENPKIAVEVLLGHGKCLIIAETSVHMEQSAIDNIVGRITKTGMDVEYREVPQDEHLAKNQDNAFRCGDNGIFKGFPLSDEEKTLADFAKNMYLRFPNDGKYILDKRNGELVICQSNADSKSIYDVLSCWNITTWSEIHKNNIKINPIGDWTGGSDVDAGATNRKLGSDMAQSVTGGGLHGKDLSKADVSVNIFAFCLAQMWGRPVEFSCAIGDTEVGGFPYEAIVGFAKGYIQSIGGFEKFAEWGLVR